jgi:uncharacterized membrane protein
MNPYVSLITCHIVCVIVWLGTTTTLALLAAYGTLHRDSELMGRMPALNRWFGPRTIGPASLGTLASGILLARYGHANFAAPWLALALIAFAAAALTSLGVRLPATLRRKHAAAAGSGAEVERSDRWVLWGSTMELTILYLAVVDMVVKPSAVTQALLVAGAVLAAVGLLGWVALLGPAAHARRSA